MQRLREWVDGTAPTPHATPGPTLQNGGEPVLLVDGVCWSPMGRFSLQTIPSGRRLCLAPEAVRDALRRTGRLVALYPSDATVSPPLDLFVARREGFGPHRQQRQFRQQVRAGRRHCQVSPLSWQALEREGLAVNRAAWAAGRSARAHWCKPQPWARFCRALAQDPQMEAWGCRVEGRLAAFIVVWSVQGTAHGLTLQWDPALAWAHPTHCLHAELLEQLLQPGGAEVVVAGRQLIPARPDQERFKRHAGYLPEPCPVRVVAHPLLAPFLCGLPAAALLRRVERLGRDLWPALNHLEVLARVCEQAASPAP